MSKRATCILVQYALRMLLMINMHTSMCAVQMYETTLHYVMIFTDFEGCEQVQQLRKDIARPEKSPGKPFQAHAGACTP